jgi:hypothetical protein
LIVFGTGERLEHTEVIGAKQAIEQIQVLGTGRPRARPDAFVEPIDGVQPAPPNAKIRTRAEVTVNVTVEPRPFCPRCDRDWSLSFFLTGRHHHAAGHEFDGVIVECGDHRVGPSRVHADVVVDKRNQVMRRLLPAEVAGQARTGAVGSDQPSVVLVGYGGDRRRVGRTGVHHHHLVAGTDVGAQRFKAGVEFGWPVLRRYDDRQG